MGRVKGFLKRIIPSRIIKYLRYLEIRKKINNQWGRYDSKVEQLKTKSKIRVVFFVIHSSIWKYDSLYQLLENDDIFEPLVLVCPYLKVDTIEMHNEMNRTYDALKNKKYRIKKAFNDKKCSWIDIKKEFKPDIVFYSVPYSYTRKEYQFLNFKDALNCYVPYFYVTNNRNTANYDLEFHNMMWKLFYETSIHKKLASKYSRTKGYNVIVSGYPGLDHFLFEKKETSDPWKIKDESVKRIIWAPHHTIEGHGTSLDYSNFTVYHDFFKKLLQLKKDSIQIAFKPHPLLKQKLYRNEHWGKLRTENYYKFWAEQENSMLCDSEYIDLFLTSDALIHDCSSFMAEYLSTKKPALYLLRDKGVRKRINEFGKLALDQHYHASDEQDIISFIDELLKNNDPKKKERIEFINKQLLPPNNKTASENIYHELKPRLGSSE